MFINYNRIKIAFVLKNIWTLMKTIQLNFKEKLILLIASVCLTISAFFLISFDHFLSSGEEKLTPFGSVQAKHHQLKRKNSEGMVWGDLETNMQVYLGDKIFTSDGSNAVIKIGQNSFIEMSPLTLIQLKQNESKKLQIDLQDGSLKAKIEKDDLDSIQTKTTEVDLDNENTELIIDSHNEKGSIVVLSGAAIIGNESNRQKIKADEMATFSNNNISQAFKIDYIPLKPNNSVPLATSQLKSTEFKWKVISNNQANKIIEVSQEKEFKTILKEIISAKDKEIVDLSTLQSGTFFWRIRPSENKSTPGQFQKFVIFNDSPPKLLNPLNNIDIYKPQESSKIVNFSWEDVSAQRYIFETNAKNNDSRDEIFQSTTTTNKTQLSINNYGEYWWRVRAVSQQHSGPWSEKNYFKVHGHELAQKTVYLLPANESFHDLESQVIQFKWKGSPHIIYKLIISKDISFNNPLIEEFSKEGSYDWRVSTTGNIFWKVVPLKNETSVDTWSFNIRKPIIEHKAPEDAKKIIFDKKTLALDFEWSIKSKNGINLTGVRILSIIKDGSEIEQIKTTSDRIQWEAKAPGRYQWKVNFLDAQSEAYSFEITEPPKLEAPKIKKETRSRIKKKKLSFLRLLDNNQIHFAQNGKIVFDQEPTIVTFAELKWDSIEGAKNYYLEIYKDKAGKDLLLARKLKENFFHWQGAPTGTYFFRVCYENNNSQKSPFSQLGRLIVEDIKETDRFIELKYPKHKHSTFGERFGFEWKTVEQAQKYVLVIKDFHSKKILKKIESSNGSLMTPLPSGLYRWQVYGIESDLEVAISEERFLKIADTHNLKILKSNSQGQLLKNFFGFDALIGQIHSKSKVTRSSTTYNNSENLSLFPSSFRFSSLLNLNNQNFVTTSLDYKDGSTDSVNFLSQVTISGAINRAIKTTDHFLFYYGPAIKYDSLSLVSEDNSSNIGGSNLSYISLGAQAGFIHQIDNQKTFIHQLNIDSQFSFITVQGQTINVLYHLRKNKIPFLKSFKSVYENFYTHAGVKYSQQTAKTSDDSLNLVSWEFPIGIGVYLD